MVIAASPAIRASQAMNWSSVFTAAASRSGQCRLQHLLGRRRASGARATARYMRSSPPPVIASSDSNSTPGFDIFSRQSNSSWVTTGRRDVAHLARQRHPAALRQRGERCHAKPGAGPQHDLHGGLLRRLAADLHDVLAVEMGQRQGQRLEIIEQAELARLGGLPQRLAGEAPVAVGEAPPSRPRPAPPRRWRPLPARVSPWP